ncbi:MAG: hypothetical protein IKY29_05395 [Clostridia bacterium]|nr:hypothetical protein [Clostridia bacterium]
MTYQHALRYLTLPDTTSSGNTRALLRAYVSQTKAAPPLFIHFTANKLGHTTALFLQGALAQAGISCLHWIDDAATEPKLRFRLDGKPITPPLLARLAGELHGMEMASPDVTLGDAERCAALLCRLAAEEGCRVVLLESMQETPVLPVFCAIHPRLNAIAVLSDKKDVVSDTIRSNVRLVITPTYGPAFYRRISDACAASNIRLEIIKKSSRTAVTLGAQTLSYGKFPDCRIASGSSLVATAAFLAMECVQTLTRMRFSIDTAALQNGLRTADLSHALHLRCIQPLLLSDIVTTDEELLLSLADISELCPHLPAPRRLWLEDSLSDPPPQFSALFDEICRNDTEPCLLPEGTTLAIGCAAFVDAFIKNALRKPKKS